MGPLLGAWHSVGLVVRPRVDGTDGVDGSGAVQVALFLDGRPLHAESAEGSDAVVDHGPEATPEASSDASAEDWAWGATGASAQGPGRGPAQGAWAGLALEWSLAQCAETQAEVGQGHCHG